MRGKTKAAALLGAAAMVGVAAGGISIELGPNDARTKLRWQTVLTGRKAVQWVWPDTAQSARLTVTGLKGTRELVADRSVASFDLGALPRSEIEEDVLALRLDFYAASDATGTPLAGETLTADGLGFVCQQTAHMRACASDSRKWSRVTTDVLVTQAPSDAKSVSCDGTPVALASVPGWVGCLTGETGHSFTLTLADDAGTHESRLTHVAEPMAVIIR